MKHSALLLVGMVITSAAFAAEPDGTTKVRSFNKADELTVLLHEFKGRPAEPVKATVDEVRSNGMLKVSAHTEKDVRVRKQKRTLWSILSGQEIFVTEIETHAFSLSGLVPANKVAADNTVSSNEVFDLAIVREIAATRKSSRTPSP